MDQFQPDVNENSVQVPVVDPQTQVTPTPEDVGKPVPGDKTESALLLKSLQEEREKRRQLEEELLLKSSVSDDASESSSDEGRAIMAELKALKSELSEVKQDSAKKDLLFTHPILKDKWEAFEAFREDPENKGMNLRTAAKAFMVEEGLLEVPRRGVEPTRGGTRTPLSTGMSVEDAKSLRESNPRKWKEMVTKGQLNIE